MTERPFYRSRDDRMIAFVIFSIASAAFPGIIVYLVLWLLMPLAGDA